MPSWVTKVVLPSAASCAGLLAERRGVAFDVEQIVGDLEGFAERAAVIVERLIFLLRGLAEDGAGDAAEAQQRAGLHLLQPRDVDRLAVAEPAFAGEVEHLAADHAADAGGARQRPRQQQAHRGVLVDLVAGDDVERQRQQRRRRRGSRWRRRSVLCRVGPAAAQIAVVHRRQIVMDQRIAVDAFQRRAGQQRGLARNAEHRRALDHQERPQPLAAAEARIAHRLHQPLRPRDLVGQQRVRQQFASRASVSSAVWSSRLAKSVVQRSVIKKGSRSNSAGQSLMASASSIPCRGPMRLKSAGKRTNYQGDVTWMRAYSSARPPCAEPETPDLRIVRNLLLIVLAVLLLPYLLTPFYRAGHPVSTLMVWRWLTGAPVSRQWIDFGAISPSLPRSVVGSEDAKFCSHHGIDWDALREVIDDAEDGEVTRGGSTITQQVAKNLFLWPGRSVVRKALELPLALWIDLVLPKQRILEIYLNIAELGPSGQFGAEAGAMYAFGHPAADSVAARGGAAGGDPAQSGPAQRPQSRSRGAAAGRDLYGAGAVRGLQRCWRENRAF